jgi:hypothetical protein
MASGRGTPLSGLGHTDLDCWLLTGPPALREAAGDFLTWAAARRLAPRLTLSRGQSRAAPRSGRRHPVGAGPPTFARARHRRHRSGYGCFLLLYGQQLSRIAGMTRAQVRDHSSNRLNGPSPCSLNALWLSGLSAAPRSQSAGTAPGPGPGRSLTVHDHGSVWSGAARPVLLSRPTGPSCVVW